MVAADARRWLRLCGLHGGLVRRVTKVSEVPSQDFELAGTRVFARWRHTSPLVRVARGAGSHRAPVPSMVRQESPLPLTTRASSVTSTWRLLRRKQIAIPRPKR